MRRIFTICALSLASFLGVSAQTPADSVMIADAGWKQTAGSVVSLSLWCAAAYCDSAGFA